MGLINTDGLVLIGPGSEWLWSFLSDIALVLTLVGVFFQLRADRATRVFDQTTAIRAGWASKEARYERLVALIDLEGRTVDDGMPPSAYGPCNWFGRLGYFVKGGHVNLEQIASVFADDVLWWWATCEPYIRRDRERHDLPKILADFESLASAMAVYWRAQAGSDYVVRETIGEQIEGYTALLRRHFDIERGVIPERRPAPATSPSNGSEGGQVPKPTAPPNVPEPEAAG